MNPFNEEPPKFADFTNKQIQEMIDYWSAKIQIEEDQQRVEVDEVEVEEQKQYDYILSLYNEEIKKAQKHYTDRKERIRETHSLELNKLRKLIESLRCRL
jgi:Ser-tRNA(Ala) deacylase AlaX